MGCTRAWGDFLFIESRGYTTSSYKIKTLADLPPSPISDLSLVCVPYLATRSLSPQRERVHVYLPVRAAHTVQPPPPLLDAREARTLRGREHRPAEPSRAQKVARLQREQQASLWLVRVEQGGGGGEQGEEVGRCLRQGTNG